VTTYRLGKLPATRPHGLRELAVYAQGRLPQPPAEWPVPRASYPLDGNSQWGCCVASGAAHLVAAWDAAFQESDPVPNEDEVVRTYFDLTGGPDSGLNEATVLGVWQRVGLFGERIAGYAPVATSDIVGLHQAVALYGGAMLGIACPESAQQQFAAGEPWTVVPGSQILGGHCVIALGYTPQAVLCATWGGIAQVTYPFLAAYLDEAWAILPHQLVEARKDGLGIDLETLQADLRNI
jgi:hypothetical protein